MKKIAIMGGGISGLSSAFYLSRRFPSALITIYEGSSRLGGCIETAKFPNGYKYDLGPKTIRASNFCENVLEISKEIGIIDKSSFSNLNLS